MRIHREDAERRRSISAYGPGFIVLAGIRYEHGTIIDALGGVSAWAPPRIAELSLDHLRPAFRHTVDILLLGTGSAQCFPPARVFSTVAAEDAGLEVMDTAAACRTYNILVAEGRSVAAALMLPRSQPF